MAESLIDRLARSLAGDVSRRGVVAGVAALAARLVETGTGVGACPSGRVSRREVCLCKATGRPPVDGRCPCPNGQVDTGDGLGCLACRGDADCPIPTKPCLAVACESGACRTTQRYDLEGCCVPVRSPLNPTSGPCRSDEECCDGGTCCDFGPLAEPACFDLQSNQLACGTTCANAVNCSNFAFLHLCIEGVCVDVA